MITESFENYKGYIIRLRAGTGIGFGYSIIKECLNENSPNGKKKLYLRMMAFDFIKPESLLLKAKNYIDEYSNKLEEKYNRLVSEHSNPLLKQLEK